MRGYPAGSLGVPKEKHTVVWLLAEMCQKVEGSKDKEGENGIHSGEQQEDVVMCAEQLEENQHEFAFKDHGGTVLTHEMKPLFSDVKKC